MNTKETHISKMRERYASNRQSILAATGLTEDEYNNMWMDMAHAFLAAEYPPADVKYVAYYRVIINDRSFWRWWLSEWKIREHSFVQMFGNATQSQFERMMMCMLEADEVHASFNHFLKNFKTRI